MSLVYAIAVLGVLGAVFGLVLAVASKVFAVETDERLEPMIEARCYDMPGGRERKRRVLEFGSRRAQGADGAILGARAAYIGGCHGTACTISDQRYGVFAGGTMAHSWVQMFDSQLEAFKAYCRTYPTNAVLLVDTYNTLKSGVPDAIRAFNEVLKPMGITKCGIRLDSGDMAYLTREARKMLDGAGWTECQITVSNALDEHLIQDLLRQGACIDMFGVGERLITARSEPVFGGVYKLAGDTAEIIDPAALLRRPLDHRPLEQIVGHQVPVLV